jgi:serine/threonine-protein kinase HipA
VTSNVLVVWQYGHRVAVVERDARGRLRLSYTEEAHEAFAPGLPLLSWSMPLVGTRYPHGTVKPFFDGLLPEGYARLAIAADLGLLADDTFGLLNVLGRDSAGALIILPDGEPPPAQSTTATATPLTDEELATLVSRLRVAPLGVDERVRLSLAGVQEKLVLTRMPDGAWGRPVDGTPSTHILKPAIAAYPYTVENEAFCMRVAKHLDLPVAGVETIVVQDRKLLVVERYDRVLHADGRVERVHQEDFCQALRVSPDRKYQELGGPSLRNIARVVDVAVGPEALETLLRMVVLNVLIGNADAHAKNFSLLHLPDGTMRLAPLYDLVSTLGYPGLDPGLAMYVDDVRRITRVSGERVINEGVSWGLPRSRATDAVEDLLVRAAAAADAAQAETAGLPATVRTTFDLQLAMLRVSG